MKNKKFLLIQAFYDTILLVQALLSLYHFFFLDFLILVLQLYRQGEHNTINLFSKLLLPWPVKQRFPKLLQAGAV